MQEVVLVAYAICIMFLIYFISLIVIDIKNFLR